MKEINYGDIQFRINEIIRLALHMQNSETLSELSTPFHYLLKEVEKLIPIELLKKESTVAHVMCELEDAEEYIKIYADGKFGLIKEEEENENG